MLSALWPLPDIALDPFGKDARREVGRVGLPGDFPYQWSSCKKSTASSSMWPLPQNRECAKCPCV